MTKSYPPLAIALYKAGFEPIPITPGLKYWNNRDWQKCDLPITPWPQNHGIGLRTGKSVWGLDIDVADKQIVKSLLSFIDFDHLTRIGKPPKVLIPIKCAEIETKLISDGYCDQHGELHRIEVLAKGQQFVAYGIHPDTNKPYQWSGDLLSHSLPEVTREWVLYFFDLFYDLASKRGWENISCKADRAAKSVREKRSAPLDQNSPSSIYNQNVPITFLLKHYGWCHYKGQYWTRPGKKTGISASVFDDRILYPFTSSTSLIPEKCYDAFELMTHFDFDGDKSASAKALLREAA